MGYKVKARQKESGREPKAEKFQRSVVLDSVRNYRGSKMRDRRLRRPYEKTDEHEGWD